MTLKERLEFLQAKFSIFNLDGCPLIKIEEEDQVIRKDIGILDDEMLFVQQPNIGEGNVTPLSQRERLEVVLCS